MKDQDVIEIIQEVSHPKVIMATDPRNKSLEAWDDAGCPVVLISMGSIDNISLWGDQGYGRLFLIKGKKLVDQGKDFVSLIAKEAIYVGLSEYFGIPQAGLYKREVK